MREFPGGAWGEIKVMQGKPSWAHGDEPQGVIPLQPDGQAFVDCAADFSDRRRARRWARKHGGRFSVEHRHGRRYYSVKVRVDVYHVPWDPGVYRADIPASVVTGETLRYTPIFFGRTP